MIVLLGKTCSGKTSVQNELLKHGFHNLVTYTTRPIRTGEEQGKSYHFINTEDFKQKIQEGFFMEYNSYKTNEGNWYYGSAIQDYEEADEKTIVILSPEGYRKFLNTIFIDHKSIYLYANNKTINERLLARGDHKGEAERRVLEDNKDFKGIENEVNRIIYNNIGNDLNDVVQTVLAYIKEGKSN